MQAVKKLYVYVTLQYTCNVHHSYMYMYDSLGECEWVMHTCTYLCMHGCVGVHVHVSHLLVQRS
jgi:hypothetical protein